MKRNLLIYLTSVYICESLFYQKYNYEVIHVDKKTLLTTKRVHGFIKSNSSAEPDDYASIYLDFDPDFDLSSIKSLSKYSILLYTLKKQILRILFFLKLSKTLTPGFSTPTMTSYSTAFSN